MGNGPQSTPIYTPEDLEWINSRRAGRGQKPLDEFGVELTAEPFVTPPPAPRTVPAPEIETPLTQELQTFGAPGPLEPTRAQQEREARRDYEKAFDALVQANFQELLVKGAFKQVPQLRDLQYTDPDFQTRLKDYAREQALRQSRGDVSLIPRTALPGFVPDLPLGGAIYPPVEPAPPFEFEAPPGALGPPQPPRPPRAGRMLPEAQVIPDTEPVPSLEPPRVLQDPTGVARGVATALRPQTRVGEAEADILSAQRAEQIKAGLPTPEQYAQQRGLDLDIHKDIAERDRLLALAKTQTLSGEDIASLERLQEKTKGRTRKTILDDIQDYASFIGVKAALEKYVDDPLVRRTQTGEQVTQYILSEIKELPELMRIPKPDEFIDPGLGFAKIDPREGDPRFKRHRIGEESSDPGLLDALSRQYKSGFVPVLSDVQKEFLSASTPIVRQAYVDILPYEEQRGIQMRLERAQRAPTFGAGAPAVLPVAPTSPFVDRPKPLTVQEAQAQYSAAIEAAGVADFYAADFFDDPEKYAQGWSWWNKSYPSGATIEGPVQWGLRVVAAPANVSSRLVYETLRETGPMKSLESVLDVREPTEEQRLQEGEDPLYINHPYLRAIAENRGMMDDFYDLYYYNDYKKTAYLAGSLGLAADILLSPYDPGISQTVKGAKAAGQGVKSARAVGMPIRTSDVADDFIRGFVDGVGDQVLAVDLMRLPKNATMLDPVEYGATRAASYMQGAAAYKLAAGQAASIGKTPTAETTHNDIMRAALEIMQVGDSGNRFIDEAAKRGPEWALAAADNIGKEAGDAGRAYTKYQEELAKFMRGEIDELPNYPLSIRLMNRVLEEDPQLARLVDVELSAEERPTLTGVIEEKIRTERARDKVIGEEFDPRTEEKLIRVIPGEVFESQSVEEATATIDQANRELNKIQRSQVILQRERDELEDAADAISQQIRELEEAGEVEQPEGVVSLFGAARPSRISALKKQEEDLEKLLQQKQSQIDVNIKEAARIQDEVIPALERELDILSREAAGGVRKLRTRLADPGDVRPFFPNFSPVEILDAAKALGLTNYMFMRMLEPLSFKVAQSGISNALEASKILGPGWRNLRMITPALFVHKSNVRRLGELVGESTIGTDLQKIASKSDVVHGLHKNRDFRLAVGTQQQVDAPKTGAYINLSDEDADLLEDITLILVNDGFITGPEKAAILYQVMPQSPRGTTRNVAAVRLLSNRVISRENLSRLMDANIERVAYNNRIGIETEVFETASTETKRALREPLESRHLTQRSFTSRFSKLLGLAKDKTSWSKNYAEGVPLYVVQELDVIRGKLSSMDVVLRRDLRLLVEDTELQKSYFESDWLARNKVTQDDALVALALGPLDARTIPKTKKALDNILSIITVSEQDTSLNIMDVFRRTSVQRSSILNSLTYEGVKSLNNIKSQLGRYLSGMPSAYGTVNGAEDFIRLLTNYRTRLESIITDSSNIKDPAVRLQVAAPKFGEITTGFYYLQQQQRIIDEGISNIVKRWPGYEFLKVTPALAGAAGRVIDDFTKLILDTVKELQDEAVAAPVSPLRTVGPGGRVPLRNAAVVERDAKLKMLKDLEEAFFALNDKLDKGQFVGDYLARRVQDLLNYRANPTSEDLDRIAFSTDWKDIINSFFPDELTSNALFQNVLRRIIDDFTTPRGAAGGPLDLERQKSLEAAAQLMVAHNQANKNALEIIKANGLNSGNLNETLTAVDRLFEIVSTVTRGRVTGPKKTDRATVSGPFTTDIVLRELSGAADHTELVASLAKLSMGTPISKEMEDITNKSQQVKQIRDAILDLFEKNTTIGYKVASRIDATLSWLTKMRYGAILGSRVAFHATNVTTAPFLVWGTLGGRAAFESVANAKVATEILLHGLKPTGIKTSIYTPAGTQIAVTDPFGRSYTYQEVYDMALGTGAMKSRTGVMMSETQFAEILRDTRFMPEYSNFISKGLSKFFEAGGAGAALGAAIGAPSPTLMAGAAALGASVVPAGRSLLEAGMRLDPSRLRQSAIGKFLTDMTEMEDQVFRLATVIGALKRGDDPSQALAAGRRALLDYGDLTPQEKWAMSRWAMFYSFFRLNLENTFKLLFRNPKRFVNIMRAAQTGGRLGRAMTADDMSYQTSELDFYKHHFLLSRPMINYVEGSDKTTHYEVLPGIPILDAFSTIAQIISNPIGATAETMRGFVDPTARALLGTEQQMVWRKPYVDPRDMLILSDTAWGSYFFDVIIKEQPKGRPAKVGEEAWQGQVWTLSPQALERYQYFKNNVAPFMTIPGVFEGDTLPFTLMVTGQDPRLTGRRFGPGLPQVFDQPLGVARTIAGVTGQIKDIGGMPISDQRRAQLREMERRLRELEKQRGVPSIKQLKSRKPRPK